MNVILITLLVSLRLEFSECNNSLFSMTELGVLFLHYHSFTVFTARARATKGALVRHHTRKYFNFYWGYVGLSAAWLRDWSSEAVPHAEDLSSSSSKFCKSRVTLILAFFMLKQMILKDDIH